MSGVDIPRLSRGCCPTFPVSDPLPLRGCPPLQGDSKPRRIKHATLPLGLLLSKLGIGVESGDKERCGDQARGGCERSNVREREGSRFASVCAAKERDLVTCGADHPSCESRGMFLVTKHRESIPSHSGGTVCIHPRIVPASPILPASLCSPMRRG
jgi:hypothetical protein